MGKYRWDTVSDIINGRGYTEIAEIGVQHCINANNILELSPGIKIFFLIDPALTHICYFPKMDKKGRIADPRSIIRHTSEYASKFFKDETLDLVFIDGDHSYEAVKLDIALWYPKVKVGGCLCGHDYAVKPPVKQAVDEIFPSCRFDGDHVWLMDKTHRIITDEEESHSSK